MRQKTIIALIALAAMATAAKAQQILTPEKIRINSYQLVTNPDGKLYANINYTLTEDLKVTSNRMLTLTPMIFADSTVGNGNRSLSKSVFYGRKRMIVQKRQDILPTNLNAFMLRKNGEEQNVESRSVIDLEPWMQECHLKLHAQLCGCGNAEEENMTISIGQMLGPFPTYEHIAFMMPIAPPVKTDSLNGSAYLDYRVNRTELDPTYRRNPAELDSIKATIAPIRGDKNVSITYATIKGYASPEGNWDNNVRLASGRAETMRAYIVNEYALDGVRFDVDFEAEDWEGLRRHIVEGNLPEKEQILAIIDDKSITDPDKRDWALKKLKCYKEKILGEIYPALRHSDYTIYYTIRDFTTEEAKEIFKVRPWQLSQAEMYRVAQTYEPGSEEFNKLFMTAVTMHPNDSTANLNAAAIALNARDTKGAEKYLAKAGNSAEANCNRAILEWLKGNEQEAYRLITLSAEAGCKQAILAKEGMRKRMK